jgi:hypothetical protein
MANRLQRKWQLMIVPEFAHNEKMSLEAQGINWYIQESNWKHKDKKGDVMQ